MKKAKTAAAHRVRFAVRVADGAAVAAFQQHFIGF
jgi:hypothetical protein